MEAQHVLGGKGRGHVRKQRRQERLKGLLTSGYARRAASCALCVATWAVGEVGDRRVRCATCQSGHVDDSGKDGVSAP